MKNPLSKTVHKSLGRLICSLGLLTGAAAPALALPPNFVEETAVSGFSSPVGMLFHSDGRMFAWEKAGKLYRVSGDQKILMLDINHEVNHAHDLGLLGVVLDPNFNSNGYLYLLYSVDYEYLLANSPYGNPQSGNINFTHDLKSATIGRLVRYTCKNPATDPTVELNSWVILLGHYDNSGSIPVHDGIITASGSHSANSLEFAQDGTLIASAGDGACWGNCAGGPDYGQGGCPSYCGDNTSDQRGITIGKEDVGAFRAQLVDSYSGKILRLDVTNIDPVRGVAGVSSNPFYDVADPYAPGSKVWATGFRNPFRFAIRPGSGSSNPANGDPGSIYIGNVGMSEWEEQEVVKVAGENHGWPIYEGQGLLNNSPFYNIHVENLDAPNPLYDGTTCTQEFFEFRDLLAQDSLNVADFPNPCDSSQQIPTDLTALHARSIMDMKNSRVYGNPSTQALTLPTYDLSGEASYMFIEDAELPLQRSTFNGASALGGVFYSRTKFPCKYRGGYFFSDTRDGWIKCAQFDANDTLIEVHDFLESSSPYSRSPVALAVGPDGALYYVKYGAGTIQRIRYTGMGIKCAVPIPLEPAGQPISVETIYPLP